MSDHKNEESNNSSLKNDLETTLAIPSKPLVTKDSSQAILNNKQLQWSFMRKTMFALFVLHLEVAILTHIFSHNLWAFKDFLRNYSEVGNGYDIFAIVVMSLIFIVSAILPNQTRMGGAPLYVLLLVLIGYLVLFSLHFAQSIYQENFSVYISAYLMFFSSSCGILLSLLFNSEKISIGPAIGIGVSIYVIQEIMMTYVYEIHNPQLWIYGLMLGGITLIILYFLLDLQMMITRRSHFY